MHEVMSNTHSRSITRQVTVSAAMTLAVLMSSLCKKKKKKKDVSEKLCNTETDLCQLNQIRLRTECLTAGPV